MSTENEINVHSLKRKALDHPEVEINKEIGEENDDVIVAKEINYPMDQTSQNNVSQLENNNKKNIAETENNNSVAQPETNMPPSKKFKRMSKEQQERFRLRQEIGQLLKSNDVPRAVQLYQQWMHENISVEICTLQMILNLCCDDAFVTTYKEVAISIFNEIKKKSLELKKKMEESTYSALIKIQSATGCLDEAFATLYELQNARIPTRLRTFSSLLVACCKVKEMEKAFELKKTMEKQDIILTEVEYASLLDVCVKLKDSTNFYKLLDEFMDNLLQPTRLTWKVLEEWFQSDASSCSQDHYLWKTSVGKVDTSGKCSITGVTLDSIDLSQDEMSKFATQVEGLVCTNEKRIKQWKEFKTWLETNQGGWDVIIDGANVGYFNQNFKEGSFSYTQIERLMKHYEDQGKKTLLVLHKRHFQQVPKEAQEIVESWHQRKVLFSCYPGNNDDWYWLYAAIYSGKKALVVTNDEMRDHHFQMFHHRSFSRWKERHQVHYNLKGHSNQRVVVQEPPVYSKRSQKLDKTWHFPDQHSDEWLCVYQVPN